MYKALFELKDKEMIYKLVSKKYYNSVFGAFETNPNYPNFKFSYREDLNNDQRYQELILFNDEEI